MRAGWFDGLPYPLQDMRPQGFLGRHFAKHHAAVLQVGEDPSTWSDDDTLHALSLFGMDTPGDLILGKTACRQWLAQLERARTDGAPAALGDAALGATYPQFAAHALAMGVAGSSAGGEFPKFTAWRQLGGEPQPRHVLVKFSGSDASPGTRRWSDLLVCESLAGQALGSGLGVEAARSRIWRAGDRTFLEVDRFDRHGLLGRSGLISWFALNATFFGTSARPWGEAGRQLAARGWLGEEDVARIERLWHFGQLIGNTDMHDGNLSFQPVAGPSGAVLRLAPAYDMLPMLYAPVRGVELPPRAYAPRLPLPADQDAWQAAAQAACGFWQAAAADTRITAAFRATCESNRRSLVKLLA